MPKIPLKSFVRIFCNKTFFFNDNKKKNIKLFQFSEKPESTEELIEAEKIVPVKTEAVVPSQNEKVVSFETEKVIPVKTEKVMPVKTEKEVPFKTVKVEEPVPVQLNEPVQPSSSGMNKDHIF